MRGRHMRPGARELDETFATAMNRMIPDDSAMPLISVATAFYGVRR
jgi:hypothetical protein